MKVILSTRNASKAAQIGALFAGTSIEVLSLDDAGIEGKAPENGDTLEANGLEKALYAWERLQGEWCMSDDSGLFIDALGGFPGVHAADWMGRDASTEEIMRGILAKMEGVENRAATFKTVATLISPDKSVRRFMGEVRGSLRKAPAAAVQQNMPYSPLFVADGQGKTWAEMSPDEENLISHRGKAFAQVRRFLLSRA